MQLSLIVRGQHPPGDGRSDVLERAEFCRGEDEDGEVGVGHHGRGPESTVEEGHLSEK